MKILVINCGSSSLKYQLRGCNSKDIEGVIAITAVQAQEQEK